MLSNLFEQHPYFTVLSIIGLVGMFLLYRYFKIKELQKNGKRNIWDLALSPSVSKLFWTGEWPIVFATGLLILVAILAITTNSDLWDMFKVNLGVVFGTCVRWAESKMQQKTEPTNQSREERG